MVSMMDILSGAVPLMGMSVKAGQAQKPAAQLGDAEAGRRW
jgi:hypothetical protein